MTSHGGRAGVVALIAVFVVACGGTAPTTSPSPSTTAPTTSTPSVGPTSTANQSPSSPQPSTSPSTDPTGTPPPQEGWVQLAAASEATAVWSPDAVHILAALSTPGGPPETNQVQLLTRDGSIVRTYEGLSDPVWLDNGRLVAYRLEWEQDEGGEWSPATGPNGERLGTAVMGAVDADALEDTDLPLGPALSNGAGALAIGRFDADQIAETAVWADGALSDWHPGAALAWSPPGNRLALIHPLPTGPQGEGWLEIVEWPGLSTIWELVPDVSVAKVSWDPTGENLAFPTYAELPRQPRQVPEFAMTVNVVELATEAMLELLAPENGDFELLSDQRVLIVGFESLEAIVTDGEGAVLAQESVVGPNVIVSADGLTALFYDAELDEPPMQILRGDALTLLESPGLMTGQAPQMARDGSGVLVVVRAQTNAPTGSPATVLLHSF